MLYCICTKYNHNPEKSQLSDNDRVYFSYRQQPGRLQATLAAAYNFPPNELHPQRPEVKTIACLFVFGSFAAKHKQTGNSR